MKILVTGANGFVGKNLIAELNNKGYKDIYKYDRNTDKELLKQYTKECDFVFHLAGVNRPKDKSEFMQGNFGFTEELLSFMQKYENKAPILITSSIQAKLENPYGISKKAGEDLVFKYSKENGVKVFVYRLPNLFGKWSKPNYNSVVATFCHNITNDIDIRIDDKSKELELAYIDDVVKEFISSMESEADNHVEDKYYLIDKTFKVTLGEIADKLYQFKESRNNLMVPNLGDEFTKNLYSTYLSYLPVDNFSYPLKMNVDNRGSFTEFLKSNDRGQVSINISKPGITKGNHWHHTKNEKFLVVSGEGTIQFRGIDSEKIIEYKVSGAKLEVIDIPVGYTHNIINTGKTDMVTVMWVNEIFNPEKPDTYFLEV